MVRFSDIQQFSGNFHGNLFAPVSKLPEVLVEWKATSPPPSLPRLTSAAIPELLESNLQTISVNPIIMLLWSQHGVLKVTTCNDCNGMLRYV